MFQKCVHFLTFKTKKNQKSTIILYTSAIVTFFWRSLLTDYQVVHYCVAIDGLYQNPLQLCLQEPARGIEAISPSDHRKN
jgi:hypothetical protein